jgi:GMP synthase PP-ATPase subunit
VSNLNESEQRLVTEVNAVLKKYGGQITGITEVPAVGVTGDARDYSPGITIELPKNIPTDRWGEIQTEIINKVKGVGRVLVDVARAE